MTVHRVDTGALVDEGRYEGPDLLRLVDEMSVDLRAALEIPVRGEIEDLPVSERLTQDDTALEALGRAFQAVFVDSDFGAAGRPLGAAATIDPTFAAAQGLFAQLLLASNRPEEAAAASRAALDHVYRLPATTKRRSERSSGTCRCSLPTTRATPSWPPCIAGWAITTSPAKTSNRRS